MPTYEYHCKACKHNFEKFLKISDMDNPLSEPCPNCNQTKVKRSIGGNYAFMSPEALGRKKAPSEFREFLRAVKKANPGSCIRDR